MSAANERPARRVYAPALAHLTAASSGAALARSGAGGAAADAVVGSGWSPPPTPGAHLTVEGQEAHYLGHVLRLRVGDALELFDGQGLLAHGRCQRFDRRSVSIALESLTRPAEPSGPWLAVGLCKRFDWVVEKATELGAAGLTAIACQHASVRLAGGRVQVKLDHWRELAIAACRQCGRNRLPLLGEPLALDAWLAARPAGPGWVATARRQPSPAGQRAPATCILIGPEGGLTPDEQAQAEAAGLAPAWLGPHVLRTETAAAAALAGWWQQVGGGCDA